MTHADEIGPFSTSRGTGELPILPRSAPSPDGGSTVSGAQSIASSPITSLSFDEALRAAVELSAAAERSHNHGQVTLIPAVPLSYQAALEAALTLTARARRGQDPDGPAADQPLLSHDEAMRTAISLAARARIAIEQGLELDIGALHPPAPAERSSDPGAAAAKVAAQAARARLTRVREQLRAPEVTRKEVPANTVETPERPRLVEPQIVPRTVEASAPASPWHRVLLDRAKDLVLQTGEQMFRPHLVLTRHADEISGPRLADLRLRPVAQVWNRSRIALAQQIWGEGAVAPGHPDLIKTLMEPLGLKRKMTVLDLGMGLGGTARVLTRHYGVAVVGMEWDRGLVRAGKAISNRRYWRSRRISINPSGMTAGRIPLGAFDRIIAKDCMMIMPDKERILRLLSEVLQEQGELLFTDLVLTDPERRSAELEDWIAGAPEACVPWTAMDYIRLLTSLGLNLQVQDMTDQILAAVAEGWAAFDNAIEETGLDSSLAGALEGEEALWTRQIGLLESGELNYYRFHVAKRF